MLNILLLSTIVARLKLSIVLSLNISLSSAIVARLRLSLVLSFNIISLLSSLGTKLVLP